MRLGFFGGTFDPPHNGHLAVARAAADRYRLDRVLLAPVASQPLKPGGAWASFADRLAMVQLLCTADSRLECSSADAPRRDGTPNFTIDTLSEVRATQASADELFVIVGIDAFAELRHWRSPDELLQVAEWLVVSRPGLEFEAVLPAVASPAQQKRVHLLGGINEPVSATILRSRLQAGESCEGLLPLPVLEYIQTHSLYGSAELPAR